jgi:hypothetical protein
VLKNISHSLKHILTSSRGKLSHPQIIFDEKRPCICSFFFRRFATPNGVSDALVNETALLSRLRFASAPAKLKALFAIDSRRVTDTLDVVHVSMRIAALIPLRLIFLSNLFLALAVRFLDVPGF